MLETIANVLICVAGFLLGWLVLYIITEQESPAWRLFILWLLFWMGICIKYVFNVLLILVLLSGLASAEQYYLISKTYYEMLENVRAIVSLSIDGIALAGYDKKDGDTFRSAEKELKKIIKNIDKVEKEVSFAGMTLREQLSLIKGSIDLLEMKLLKLRGELKQAGVKIE